MINEINQKALELAIAALNKEHGKNTVVLGNTLPEDVPVISTGNLKLDLGLGVGGLPKGRIIEIYGAEALGKSLISLSAIAECQAAGGIAVLVDVEFALDPTWAKTLGVNMDELIICQPDTGETAFDVVEKFLKTGAVDIIVVDSVAALTPQAEMEAEMDEQQIGLQARLISKGLRKTKAIIANTETCMVFINQIRDKIGYMQQGTTSPGGRSLKFYSSVRIELKGVGQLKDKKTGEVSGNRVRATVTKNRVAAPYKTVEYDVLHGIGFNNFGSILEMAEKDGLLTKKGGGYYYLPGEANSFAHGEQQAIEYLASDLEFTNSLKAKIIQNALPNR